MSYVRANTGNPNGWRPGTLGALPQVRMMRRVRRRINGLGSLDPGSQMVIGALYVFYYNCGLVGTIGCPQLADINSAAATDSNFGGASASYSGGGVAIAFTYTGKGSNILQAANELAGVLQSNISGYARFQFIRADGPVAVPPGGFTDPQTGIVYDANGNQVTPLRPTYSYPGGTPPNPPEPKPPFDFSNLFSGFGVGALVALVLGIVVVKNL